MKEEEIIVKCNITRLSIEKTFSKTRKNKTVVVIHISYVECICNSQDSALGQKDNSNLLAS